MNFATYRHRQCVLSSEDKKGRKNGALDGTDRRGNGEKGDAIGLQRAADTLDALADDIIAGRAPVSDIKDAATYLRRVAKKKLAEAEKVLNRN